MNTSHAFVRASSSICMALFIAPIPRNRLASSKRERAPILGTRKKAKPEKPKDPVFFFQEFENYYCLRKKSWRKSEGEMKWGGSSTTGRRSYCQREVDAGCDEVGLGFDIASRCQDGASQLGRREGDRVEEELGDVVRAQMQQLVVRIGLRHLEGLVGASLAVEV